MRKRTRFKSLLLDLLVILFCLSLALFFAWLFWQDLNAFTVRSDKTEIGTISLKQNVVQRRFDDRVVWERIANGTKLYYGDTIRTADMAEVTIELGESIIKLGENTMIQVGQGGAGGLQIAISGGDIQIDSGIGGGAIEVKLDDGSVVNVGAGSSLAAKSDSSTGVHNVEVKSGSAQVTTESGETAMLTYGESVNVEKGKEIQKNPISVIYPPKDLKLLNFRGGEMSVKFEWKTNGEENVVLQTSKTKNFSSTDSSRTVSDSMTEVQVGDGILYWRAFGTDSRDSIIEGKISVESIAPVKGISPVSASEFRYRTALPRIAFRWSGNEYAERYRVLVSSTPDMRSVVSDSEVSGNFMSVDTLEAGSYYWQVTPYYSLNNIGYEGASEVYSFRITRNEQIRAPELSAPAENAQLVYKDTIGANFIWKSEIKNASYELTLARDPIFNTVVFTTETNETRFTHEFSPSELRDGTYYWKILRKSGEADDTHPESEIRSFKIVRYIPQDNKLLYPPEDFSAEPSKIAGTAFMWKLADEYDNANTVSVIQIASNPNFSPIQIERATANAFIDNISLAAGNYWWRVGVRTDSGNAAAFTQARMFTVLSDLEMPEFVSPGSGQELLAYNGSPVTVSWRAVSGADYYSAKIYNKNDELVSSKGDLRGLSADFVLPEGNYTVRLQAFAENVAGSRAGAINERHFSVSAPSVIITQAPSDGAVIDGLTALREPIVFTWEGSRASVANYRLVLSKVQNDGSVKVVSGQNSTKSSLSMNRLTEGTYIWKVAASTRDGIPIDSKESRFTVTAVPELEKAVLTSPALGFVMGSSYLKSHRTIEFAWKEVAGATSYSFVLYKVEGDGRRSAVYSDRNAKGTSVTLKDLSLLDVGTFEWSVTAYSYAKDGFLEQKSGVATSSFKIDFASPTKVEAVKPGTLYGN